MARLPTRLPARRRRRRLAPAAALALAGVLAVACSSSDARRAPDFALQNLSGEAIRLSDYEGMVVLIDFWATWCGPCRRGIPHLNELYTEYGGRGFQIIGVAVADREESVRRFAEHVGIDYVTCMGTQEVVDDYGGFTSIPTAFLVDRKGNIVARYNGYQPKATLEAAILELLGGEA